MRCILSRGALPEGKCVDHDDVGGTNNGITGAVGEFIPGVGSSDLDALGQLALDSANLLLQLRTGEVAAV